MQNCGYVSGLATFIKQATGGCTFVDELLAVYSWIKEKRWISFMGRGLGNSRGNCVGTFR